MTEELKKAIDLLKRARKVIHREGWEEGESSREWEIEVITFLSKVDGFTCVNCSWYGYEPRLNASGIACPACGARCEQYKSVS